MCCAWHEKWRQSQTQCTQSWQTPVIVWFCAHHSRLYKSISGFYLYIFKNFKLACAAADLFFFFFLLNSQIPLPATLVIMVVTRMSFKSCNKRVFENYSFRRGKSWKASSFRRLLCGWRGQFPKWTQIKSVVLSQPKSLSNLLLVFLKASGFVQA